MADYKYDVAFSFLKEDEELATSLNDLIQNRLSTFLYSKRQGEIAGTDGEETFNTVFGSAARIVVVLYRTKWGTTPWTRIEETAIRNRAFNEGYDFTVFIPLESPPKLPLWLPKTRIWADLERLGAQGAVSIIEDRVKEAGGISREETVEERATRLKQQLDKERKRKAFLNSADGVKSTSEEFARLTTQLEMIVSNLSSKTGLDMACKHNINNGAFQWFEVYDMQFCVSAEWVIEYANMLDGSRLDVVLLKGRPRRPSRITLNEPVKLQHSLFHFDLDQSQNRGWRRANDSKFMTTNQLAEFCFNLLIDRIHEQELGSRS